MKQALLLLILFSFFKVDAQNIDRRQLHKLDLENSKEKKIFVEEDLCVLNSAIDSTYKDEHRAIYLFHKKAIRYNIQTTEQGKNIKDSLINAGFNNTLQVLDISKKCEWSTQLISIDSSKTYKDPYKNTIDTSSYFKANIQLNFYYPAKKKSDSFVFTGYIKTIGHKQGLKQDHTCNYKSYEVFRIVYFPNSDIYKFEFPYPDLYDYYSDFYNSELIIYF
jgi:hypothetical protein